MKAQRKHYKFKIKKKSSFCVCRVAQAWNPVKYEEITKEREIVFVCAGAVEMTKSEMESGENFKQ